jgi:hypothetical protein
MNVERFQFAGWNNKNELMIKEIITKFLTDFKVIEHFANLICSIHFIPN